MSTQVAGKAAREHKTAPDALGVPEGNPVPHPLPVDGAPVEAWDGRLPTSVSIPVPHDVARHIALPGGKAPSDLRLTLADLGPLDGMERAKVHRAVSRVAGGHWPMPVHLTGLTVRKANSEQPYDYTDEGLMDEDADEGAMPDYGEVYASASHPALSAMYQRMGAELKDAGLPFTDAPGEPPTVSLGSVNVSGQAPNWTRGPFPNWTANKLRVHEGSAATDYGLAGIAHSGATEEPLAKGELWVAESEPEQRIVYGVVLVPNIPDAHGHRVSKAEIEKAAHSFAEKGFLFGVGPHDPQHRGTPRPDITPLESYVAPHDIRLGGKLVVGGSWVMAGRTPQDIWEQVRNHELQSFSLWGRGDIVDEPEVVDAL